MSGRSSLDSQEEACHNLQQEQHASSSHHRRDHRPANVKKWEFHGWGKKISMTPIITGKFQLADFQAGHDKPHALLGEWAATAISGNDITSSCLYVTGLCIADAGIYAPFSILIAIFTLYLYKQIYAEVGTSLPMNGGTFNVLLHTTNKKTASVAACLTILSYVATGVVSATEAVEYFHSVLDSVPVIPASIAVLAFFAFLSLMGVTESAFAAVLIFVTHILTLSILIIACIVYLCEHGFSTLVDNWDYGAPHGMGWEKALFYGFSSAMLGVSGFESSAQFIEEQKDGVFVKTLRNMWVSVAVINPVLCFLCLCIVPVQQLLADGQIRKSSLAHMGRVTGGEWLEYLVAVDAFIVLSGAVLTAYVGVGGLLRRLARDRCMPGFLLSENSCRHTNHWIIVGFFLVCTSMLVVLEGDVATLSSVYSVCFLGLMVMFGVGHMLLKYKRAALPRSLAASWPTVLFGVSLVGVALGSTVEKSPLVLTNFTAYFAGTSLLVFVMLMRKLFVKLFLSASWALVTSPRFKSMRHLIREGLCCCCVERGTGRSFVARLERYFATVDHWNVMFFAKTDDISVLNKALLYVRENEDCGWVKIIHCYDSKRDIPRQLEFNVALLDRIYPKLRIDLVLVQSDFGPDIIDRLSKHTGTPKNRMFIACPSEKFAYSVGKLGGVRLITH